jgi:hypothetical protein
VTEVEWLACDDEWRMLEYLRQTPVGKRKPRLVGLACCGFPRPFSDQRVTAFAEAIADYAEGEVSLARVQVRRGVAISEPCLPGAALSTYDREVLCLDRFAEGSAVKALSDLLAGLRRHREDPALDKWVRPAWWCALLRDAFGNPFRPVAVLPEWRTDTTVSLARTMYESRDFGAMPILADALQDAGCDSAEILDHCRGPGPHVRGCWVVDLVLGKE